MSSFPPPYPYFNGIIYDQAFFNQTSSGLTLELANTKFLKKTTPDTATALETFSGGAKTNNLDPITAGGTLSLGSSGVSNVVGINTIANRSGQINIGTGNASSGQINIGSGNGSSNIVNILSGTYIAFQSVGTVNILSGSNASGSFGGNMNLFTTARGTLTVGGSNNTAILFEKEPSFNRGFTAGQQATFNSSMRLFGATNNFQATDNPATPTSTVRIQASASNPFVSLLNGTGGISTFSLTELGPSSGIAFSLCPNQSTGDLSIANGSRDGNILIGTKNSLVTGTNKIIMGALGNTFTVASDTITIKNPLNPDYNALYSATTGTGSGKVGEVIQTGPNSVSLLAGAPKTLAFLDIPIGVWYLQGCCGTAGNGAGYNFLGISTADNVLQFKGSSNITGNGTFDHNMNCNWVFSVTTVTTKYYLTAQSQFAGTWINIYFQATRIA
jgi:hypothetical protein